MSAFYKLGTSILLVVFCYLSAGVMAAAYGNLIGNFNRPEVFAVYATVFLLVIVRSIFYKYELLSDPKYGFGVPDPRSLLYCLLIAIVLFQIDVFINTFSYWKELGLGPRVSNFYIALAESMSEFPAPQGVWLLTIQAVVFGSIYEEIAFRGVLQPALTNTRIGVPGAILVTSVLWTADHMQSGMGLALLSVFIMGVVLGLIRQYFNNIYLCIMVHLAVNFGWVFLSYTFHS